MLYKGLTPLRWNLPSCQIFSIWKTTSAAQWNRKCRNSKSNSFRRHHNSIRSVFRCL